MKNRKTISRIVIILMAFVLLFSATGCSSLREKAKGKISIVTTIFPEYDWVRNILGDKTDSTNLTLLIDNGVDLHSYQPSVSDIVTISKCDVFIYVGGESDAWVEETLKNKTNQKMVVIDMMKLLAESLQEEELVEGMQAEETEEDHCEAPEYDEHVWLSLRNAEIICSAIADTLSEKDPANKKYYSDNLAAYLDKIKDLDGKYTEKFNAQDNKCLLFADRFPFRYLTEDYGLKYYAAFMGCSAESEASFETISFLSGKIRDMELNSVLTLEGSDHAIADTVILNSGRNNVSIKTVNSMQSVTKKDLEKGLDYLTIMESNLETIAEALK